MQGAGAIVAALALSSDGRYAASSTDRPLWQDPLLIWDLKAGKRVHAFVIKDKSKIFVRSSVFFTGRPSCRGRVDERRRAFVDLVTEQEQPVVTLEAGPIKQNEFPCAAFGADRRHLATGSQSGLVELWDLQNGKKLQTFAGHMGVVGSVACSADGRLILSAGSDNTARLWDVASGKEINQLRSDERQVRCVAFSPDSRRALSGGLDGPVHFWDLASGKEVVPDGRAYHGGELRRFLA